RDHYLVMGSILRRNGRYKVPPDVLNWILAHYQIVAQYGSVATSNFPGFFRGNDQMIYVLKRVKRPEADAEPTASLGLKPQAEQSPPLQGGPPPSSPGRGEGDGRRGPG
ncbi:MAG TPA: hypothetical protein VIJ26_06065, partial [Thermoanaerobaculia bacterium]